MAGKKSSFGPGGGGERKEERNRSEKARII